MAAMKEQLSPKEVLAALERNGVSIAPTKPLPDGWVTRYDAQHAFFASTVTWDAVVNIQDHKRRFLAASVYSVSESLNQPCLVMTDEMLLTIWRVMHGILGMVRARPTTQGRAPKDDMSTAVWETLKTNMSDFSWTDIQGIAPSQLRVCPAQLRELGHREWDEFKAEGSYEEYLVSLVRSCGLHLGFSYVDTDPMNSGVAWLPFVLVDVRGGNDGVLRTLTLMRASLELAIKAYGAAISAHATVTGSRLAGDGPDIRESKRRRTAGATDHAWPKPTPMNETRSAFGVVAAGTDWQVWTMEYDGSGSFETRRIWEGSIDQLPMLLQFFSVMETIGETSRVRSVELGDWLWWIAASKAMGRNRDLLTSALEKERRRVHAKRRDTPVAALSVTEAKPDSDPEMKENYLCACWVCYLTVGTLTKWPAPNPALPGQEGFCWLQWFKTQAEESGQKVDAEEIRQSDEETPSGARSPLTQDNLARIGDRRKDLKANIEAWSSGVRLDTVPQSRKRLAPAEL